MHAVVSPLLRRHAPTLAVFLVVVGGLIARRQHLRPLWEPRGADWGMWFASAAWPFHDVQWPPVRWPLWGFSAAFFDQVSPAPLHVDAMIVSMICTGVAAAATFALVRPLAGWIAALCGVALLILHPMTLEMGGWLGGYSMWAMTGPLAAAGLAAAVRGRSSAWWVAGVALGVCLAVQEKGILTAMGMAPAFALGLLIEARRTSRRGAGLAAARVLLPVAVLALAYAVFPGPLASLDAQVSLQTDGRPAPPPQLAVIDKSKTIEQPDAPTATQGWIFGRQMGPMTIVGLAKKGLAPHSPATDAEHAAKLRYVLAESFPGGDLRVVPVLAGAALVAAIGALTRLLREREWDATVAALALLGVVASGLPALRSDFNLRFLLGAVWAIPPLAVMGFAFAGRLVGAPASAARFTGPAAALLGTALLGGPFRVATTWMWDSCPVFLKSEPNEHVAGRVWLDLQKGWPGVPIDVQAPFKGGALAVEGRSGRYLSGLDLAIEPAAPDHWLILPSRASRNVIGKPASALGLTSMRGESIDTGERRVAAAWPTEGNLSLFLLTPDAAP